MPIALTAEQRAIVNSLAELSESEFAEKVFTWNGETPWSNLQKLAEYGFLGLNYDVEYGGEGLDEFDSLLAIETVGRICPDTAQYVLNQQLIGPRYIHDFGSEQLKKEYLPQLLEGTDLIAIAISEPEAGSDVNAMNTTVREEDSELTLSGEKTWVSYADEASAAVVWAKFPEGLGTVLVDLDRPGVEINQEFTNLAGHSQYHIYFEDVEISNEKVLVRGEEAFRELLRTLNWERLGTVAFTNAMAINAVEQALEYAETREQFGQSINEFQGIAWKLADIATKVQVSRAHMYQVAKKAVNSDTHPDPMATAMAKLYSAEMVEEVVSEALQIHGANGYMESHPISYLYRLARGRRIGAGTDEIMKNTIAKRLKRNGFPSLIE